jgi:hypothetical protein
LLAGAQWRARAEPLRRSADRRPPLRPFQSSNEETHMLRYAAIFFIFIVIFLVTLLMGVVRR